MVTETGIFIAYQEVFLYIFSAYRVCFVAGNIRLSAFKSNAIMNILITNSTDIFAGGEMYVLWLAQTLQENGHKVCVSCSPGHLLETKCCQVGIPVATISYPPHGKEWTTIKRLREIIKANDIDLVHSNANYDRTYSAFASRLTKIPHVAGIHSLHSVQHNVTHWFRNRFATDYFIVDGTSIRDLLVQEDGIHPERIAVIHLGIPLVGTTRDEEKRKHVRSEFHIADDELVVGNVARMVPFKGHSVLLQAAAEILQQCCNVKFLLVGDGELQHELQQQAYHLRPAHGTEHFIFAGFRDDLQAMYSAFDIYVHPSIDFGGETFPLAVLQALTSGLPTIVTTVGDVPSMVKDGYNGFVVPPSDASALAKQLILLLERYDLRRQMGQHSLEYVKTHFTIDQMTRQVEAVYENVLRTKSQKKKSS